MDNQFKNLQQKKKFLIDLAKHPEVLEKFPIEKLKKILEVYIDENKKRN